MFIACFIALHVTYRCSIVLMTVTLRKALGMDSTYLQPNAVIDAGLCDRFATPYVWDEDTEKLRAVQWIQASEA